MKINTTSPINFGYNKEYHNQLHKNLESKKRDKLYAQKLVELDKFSLQVEDEIIELENKKKTGSVAYQKLSNLLLDIKNTLSYHMDTILKAQNYTVSLADNYIEETAYLDDINAIGWRENLALDLIDDLDDDKLIQLDPSIKKEIEGYYNSNNNDADDVIDKNCIEQNQKTNKKNANDKSQNIPNTLSLYTKTQSSPNGFDDVVGFEVQKQEFRDEIITYIENPQQAKLDESEYGIRAPRGYLFYGPPGCGKTFITEALAAETGLDMYKMDVSKTGSMYINESSNNIQKAFDYISSMAKEKGQPMLLFMDEVDSLAMKRMQTTGGVSEDLKVTNTLLKLIESARDNGIIIIAASNKYDLLDDAFVARFDGQKYFGLPDEKQIADLLKKSLLKRSKGIELATNDEEIEKLSKELKGFSNRSIVFMVDTAAKQAKSNNRADISSDDIRDAIKNTELQKVNEEDYKKHKNNNKTIGF